VVLPHQDAPTGATEEYNGSTWTAGGSLNTARRQLAGVVSNCSFSFWWWISPGVTGATEII
jgi:hypothetical protein